MDPQGELVKYLLAWLPLLGALVASSWKRGSQGVGLALAASFQFWLLYWLGAFLHALPWTSLPQTDLSLLGFEQATYALTALAIGCLSGKAVERRFLHARSPRLYSPHPQLPGLYMAAGVCAYVILSPTIGRLPTLNALTAVATQLTVVGLCLGTWKAHREGGIVALQRWLLASVAIPVFTMISMGFLGYGVIALAIVVIFVSHFYRRQWLLLLPLLLAGYMGISFYVAYMKNRNDLRAAVWGGQAYGDRWQRIGHIFSSFELFDLRNPEHLDPIDGRLNQNMLVGAAVVHLSSTNDFAHGETIWLSIIGLIPRAVWWDKQVRAGSMGFVSRFTGLEFAQGTSVGMGPVLEMYGNFGTPAVIIGMFIMGFALRIIDRAARLRLESGDWQRFATLFLVGIGLLQVGGSLFEMLTSAAAAIAVGHIAMMMFRQYQQLRKRSIDNACADRSVFVRPQ
jgi:hypothetical protein